MNIAEKIAEEGGHAISRAGAWAVLACGLIAALLLAIYGIGSKLLPPMSAFVVASTEATRTNSESYRQLAESMKSVHEANASLMRSLNTTQEQVSKSGEQIVLSVQTAQRMLEMMTSAFTMMKDAPYQRAEQIQLLKQIDASIKTLSEEIRNHGSSALTETTGQQ